MSDQETLHPSHTTDGAGYSSVRALWEAHQRDDPQAAQLCVTVAGETVVDLVAGSATADDLTGVFSVSKALAALTLSTLIADGLLSPDKPVSFYWPEFAAAGKGDLAVRELLAHRAGLVAFDGGIDLAELLDVRSAAARLARQTPLWYPGSAFGYHSFTLGVLIEELVFRVAGTSIQELYDSQIRRPLGADAYLGLPVAADPRYVPLRPADADADAGEPAEPMAQFIDQNIAEGRFEPDGISTNLAVVRRAGPVAFGGVASARGLASVLTASLGFARDGIFSPEAIGQMSQQQSWGIDRATGQVAAFGMVFLKPQARMPFGSPAAFGHDGLGGCLAFADPASDTAFAYVRQQMTPEPGADPFAFRLAKEVARCR